MRMNKLAKATCGLAITAIIAACSLSTQLDAEIEHEIETSTMLKEKAKAPAKVAADDVVRVKNDIWLGNKSTIEYDGEPLPTYLESKDGITLVSNRPIGLYEIGDMINKITSIKVRYSSDLEEKILPIAEGNKPDPNTINADWTEPSKMLVSYKGPLSCLLYTSDAADD